MIWRFRGLGNLSHEEEERIEAKAAKLVAYTFFVLGAYVLYESLKKLILREMPGAEPPRNHNSDSLACGHAGIVLYEI